MLSNKVKRKLETFTDLPAIPAVISDVINELENPNYDARKVATLIEQDQGITARLLRMANSPFYGLAKKISTIDLAIVILGSNVLKEILISLLLHRVFRNVKNTIFDVKQFWNYSIFCGAAARFLSRKLGYKLVSEAFVAGLMHDIGILILMDKFRNNFAKSCRLQSEENFSIIEAEMEVFECTHCDVGAWFAEKWNLPEQIVSAFYNHHTPFFISDNEVYSNDFIITPTFNKIKYPLTAIVSMSEWLAFECGYKKWSKSDVEPAYYISNEIISAVINNESLSPEAFLAVLKQSVLDEFEKATAMLSFNI